MSQDFATFTFSMMCSVLKFDMSIPLWSPSSFVTVKHRSLRMNKPTTINVSMRSTHTKALNGKLAVRICFIQLSFKDGQNVKPSVHKPVFDLMEFKASYAVGIDMTDLMFLWCVSTSVKTRPSVVVVFVLIQSLVGVTARTVAGINFTNISKR